MAIIAIKFYKLNIMIYEIKFNDHNSHLLRFYCVLEATVSALPHLIFTILRDIVLLHFKGEETEAQRAYITDTKSHS